MAAWWGRKGPPGRENIVFGDEAEVEQAEEVFQLLMGQTAVNKRFIGKTIHASEVVNDTISGKVLELKLTFTDGTWIRIMRGDDNNLVMEEGVV